MPIATREGTLETFVIEGGVPLSGRVRPAGQQERRAADPRCVPAHRRPGHAREHAAHPRRRGDDRAARRHRRRGRVGRGTNTLRVWAADITPRELDPELCTRIRASILLAGPLLARFGSADVPPPGGDVIGRRRVDTHLMAFEALGADVEVDREYRLRAPQGLRGRRHVPRRGERDRHRERDHGSGARRTARPPSTTPPASRTCRTCAASSYAMGAGIEGIGSNMLTIHGVDSLARLPSTAIGPDHIEVASFIGLAAVTGGDLVIEDAAVDAPALDPPRLLAARRRDRDATASDVRVAAGAGAPDRGRRRAQIPKLEDGPWPMFPADLTSIAVAVATQATGTMLIFEKMFENRLVFTDKLVRWARASCCATRIAPSSPARRSSTASAWRAPTSARAWRC